MKANHRVRGSSAVALTLVAGLAGCVDTDNRPKTLAYITETILKPSCGTVNCHSSLGKTDDLAFDSVAAARATFMNVSSPEFVLSVMKRTGDEPMPPNDIVADQDLELIQAWIDAGTPGL
ncbi:MAG: hypothetical protein KBG15_11105 [Kofleriaceae bacterium]|nr:hypothetical protein [Kofleriaceae bacterium]